jgi:hypothetical protein
MRSYPQMKDAGKAHYHEANAEACEPRSAEHAVAGRPAGIGAFYSSFLCFHMVAVYQPFPHGGRLNGTALCRCAQL